MNGGALVGAQVLTGLLAEWNYRALPRTESGAGWSEYGHVTIVIPARNEANRLPRLMRSLAGLRYQDREVVVVDDESSDGTGIVAEKMGARVIRLDELPPGWTGKNYACQAGAGATSGEWILFTDADTEHGPHSLHVSLAAARTHGAGLVSLLARQRCDTFWERLLLPYAYALYFAGAYRVNRRGGPAIANGQYMLFRRDVYERIGGHAAVRESIVEDVDLAGVAARHGVRVLLLRGEVHLSVRMYDSLGALWEGFGKNAFRFVAVSPGSGALTVAATLTFGLAVPRALRGGNRFPRLLILLTPALALLPWLRRFGVPAPYALLYPISAATFQLIALDSIRRTFSRQGATWKGRHTGRRPPASGD